MARPCDPSVLGIERCTLDRGRPALTDGRTRCTEHERAYQRQRGSPTQRGLGAAYHCNRAVVLARSTTCHWCGEGGATTADHLVPRAHGGTNAISNLVPAHLSCNARRGATVRRRD